MPADLLLTNAHLLTMSRRPAPGADSVACRDGRLLAVGAAADLTPLRGRRTEVVDLAGRLLLPGFWDCHLHLLWHGLLHSEWLDLRGAPSLGEAQERLRRFALDHPRGTLYGQGFNKNAWPGDCFPTRADLDAIVPDRPVVLASKDWHAFWCNSAALLRAHVGPEAPEPPGGRIERDARGAPTGILFEAAQGLVADLIPSPSSAALRRAPEAAQQQLHALGVVGVHNCEGSPELRALQSVAARGRLRLRVVQHLRPEDLAAAQQLGLYGSYGSEWVRVGSVKCFADGSLGSQTAAFLAPYAGRPDYTGLPTMSAEELEQLARRARPQFGLAVHAIGDRANREALDVFERLPRRGPRQRIEHAQHLAPDDLPRFARLGVIASMQPLHLVADMAVAEKHLGPERCRGAYAIGSLLQHGTHVCFGSDAPVEDPDPLRGLHAAVMRLGPDGGPAGGWQPQECITVEQALRCYTVEAAYAAGLEAESGTIEVGKWADLVALSVDVTQCPPAEIPSAHADLTVVAGRIVHSSL